MDKLDKEILVTHLKTIREWGKPLNEDLLDIIEEHVTYNNEGEILERIEEEVYQQIGEAKHEAWQDGYDEGFGEYEWEIEKIKDGAYDEGFEAGIEEGRRLTKAELREFCSA